MAVWLDPRRPLFRTRERGNEGHGLAPSGTLAHPGVMGGTTGAEGYSAVRPPLPRGAMAERSTRHVGSSETSGCVRLGGRDGESRRRDT